MRRPLALLVVLLSAGLLAAACGDAKQAATPTETSPTTTAEPPDPGRDVLEAVNSALADDDADAVWDLLSEPSKKRYGPSADDFAKSAAFAKLRRDLAPFAGRPLPIEVSEAIAGGLGVVAVSRGKHAFAAPLRLEGDVWRLELGGPLSIAVLGPDPGTKGEFVQQIGVEAHGPRSGTGVGLLYLDGVTLDAKSFSGPNSATIYANFAEPLVPGVHTVVAFVASGRNAAARAWTFEP